MAGWMDRLYPVADADDALRTRSVGWFISTFQIVLWFILLAAVLIALSSISMPFSAPNFVTFLGIAVLVGAVGFAAGGFIGFLFGVPRVGTDVDPDSGIVSNTNLEQLSDTLTKFLVGVSLVEFGKVNDMLVAFGAEVDHALARNTVVASIAAGTAKGAAAKAATAAILKGGTVIGGAGFAAELILIGSAIAGFLAAYLKSKTDLMTAFVPRDALQNKLGNVIAEQIVGRAGRDALVRQTSRIDPCARDAAAKLVQYVPPATRDPELHRLLGLGQAVLGNWQAAAEALQRAVDLFDKGKGASAELRMLTANALAKAGDADGAAAMTAESVKAAATAKNDAQSDDAALSKMFVALYKRGGFAEAIETGVPLANSPLGGSSGRLWLYLACAYGQQHASLLLDSPADPAAIRDTRDKAVAAIREALKLDRTNNRPALLIQWDKTTGADPSENDLATLADDPEIRGLLKPTAPSSG